MHGFNETTKDMESVRKGRQIMNKDVNKRMESQTGHSIFARIISSMLAVAMVLGLLGPMSGVVKAATNTSVTVGEVTIEGTVGTPIKPQTIEITVENGTFNPVALYEGKDITEYFRPFDYQMGTTAVCAL